MNTRMYKNAMCDNETVATVQRGKKSVKHWAEETDKNMEHAILKILQ